MQTGVRMPATKRKAQSYAQRAKRARTVSRAALSKRAGVKTYKKMMAQVSRLTKTIETKQAQWKTGTNISLPHNANVVLQNSAGGDLNPIRTIIGTDDPMGANTGSRIGDEITIRGLKIMAFFENSLQRARVYYRFMLIKCPRGVNPTIGNGIFQGNSGNRMLDSVNTEKFTIIWQKIFNVSASNPAPSAILPNVNGVPSGTIPAGISSRIISAWIPGKKFGRNGVLKYENNDAGQAKFFDYRFCVLAYDWFGTPELVNNVGQINEMYCKLFYKDA